MYFRDMSATQLLLLLACVALSASANAAGALTKADAEMEAEAEAAGAAEIERSLTALQAALGDAREPWVRRLEAAREALAPLLAALEAHAATVLLHSRRRLDRLQPALEERLEAARALLARTQEEVAAGAAALGMSAPVRDAAAAAARAADLLASLWPPTPGPAAPETPRPDH